MQGSGPLALEAGASGIWLAALGQNVELALRRTNRFATTYTVHRAALILTIGLVASGAARAQTQTNDLWTEARKVLDKAMQELLQDPDAADRVRASIAASAKAASAGQPTAQPVPSAAPTGVPAGQTLPPAVPQAQPERSFAEMERLYLDGKISAKEFQKYLRSQKLRPVTAQPTLTKPATPSPAPSTPTPAPTTAPATVTNAAPAAAPPPVEGTLTEVERRLDEMIKAHEARQKTATNQPAGPPELKTKRQKLDYILRQLVEGKISEEEYKAQREKILAEPD